MNLDEVPSGSEIFKEHPAEGKKLTTHVLVPGKIQALGVHILAPTLEDLLASQEGKLICGFLTHDALQLAVMTRHRLTHLATNDPDVERVESLKVWRPAPRSPSPGNTGAPGLPQR